jgi:hypothetical protein
MHGDVLVYVVLCEKMEIAHMWAVYIIGLIEVCISESNRKDLKVARLFKN